jgi:hypothetical protein
MLREEIVQVWSGLKTKFNQLSLWTKTFPNQQPWQIQSKINTLQNNYLSSFETIKQKNTQINTLQTNYNHVNNQLTTTRNELEKERRWWDKWNNNGRGFLAFSLMETEGYMNNYVIWDVNDIKKVNDYCEGFNPFNTNWFSDGDNGKEFKRLFREKVYRYYRDR